MGISLSYFFADFNQATQKNNNNINSNSNYYVNEDDFNRDCGDLTTKQLSRRWNNLFTNKFNNSKSSGYTNQENSRL